MQEKIVNITTLDGEMETFITYPAAAAVFPADTVWKKVFDLYKRRLG